MPALRAELSGLQPQVRDLPFYSTVAGQVADGDALNAAYWARNLRAPIRFWDAIQALVAEGHTQFVELSPHPTLVAALDDGLAALGVRGWVTSTLWRDRPAGHTLLEAIGALYCAGAPITWPIPSRRHIVTALPTYPFQNKRFWLESRAPAVRPNHEHRTGPRQPLDWPGTRLHSPLLPGVLFETSLSAAKTPFLADHRIDGRIVVAGAAHPSLPLSAAAEATKTD